MIQITLEEELLRIIDELKKGKLDKRVIFWENLDSKYVNIKNTAVLKVRLTDGKSAEIDISDYFFKEGK